MSHRLREKPIHLGRSKVERVALNALANSSFVQVRSKRTERINRRR
jgi:hypothetical protein